MPNFDHYVARHGEFGVQDIIERIERYEGINNKAVAISLEERWNSLMEASPLQPQLAA
jgi:hypothetical protein